MVTPTAKANRGPLGGRSVLVTRAGKDAAALRAPLEALGATVLELPAIEIGPPEDMSGLDRALANLNGYAWTVFSSRNAVEAVLTRLAELGLEARFAGQVAAVGPSTVRQLEERGVAVACMPQEANAEALVRALEAHGVAGKRILLPVGNIARPDLHDGVRAAGALVDQVIAYRTMQPTDVPGSVLEQLRRGEADVVALASPSAFRNLVSMLGSEAGRLERVHVACIGPTTANAVRECGLSPAVVARESTIDGLVAAILQIYAEDHR